ncbi:MAG: ABC transporter ATP-binding protein [Limnochordia bacterium]|jgi:ATP-binding cassette subfamily B protein
MNDQTSRIESTLNAEAKPKVVHLLRLWTFVLRSAKAMSLLFLGLMTLLSLLRPIAALLWGKYIDLAAAYLPGGQIIPLIALVSLYYAISFLTHLLWRYTEGGEDIERLDLVQANRFQEMVNSRVLRKLSKIDPEYWEVPKINDVADRTFQFINDRWDGLSRGIMVKGYLVLAKAVSVVAIAASLYIFDPWLCLIVLIAPIPSLYTLLFSERLRFKFVKENSELLRRANYYQDVLLRHGAKEVKTMGLFDFFFAKWKTVMDEYTEKQKTLYRNQTLIRMSNDLVTSGANIVANILAISLMANGKISLGALGASMSLISTLLGDTTALMASVAALVSKKNEAAMFYDLMGLEERAGSGECEKIVAVQARNLKYRYPLCKNYVLNGIDLTINRGEKVAFVGENGAGKTTFVKLVTGMLSPSHGELLINEIPADVLSLESRVGEISTVSQSPPRYQTFTVADNVFLGDTLRPRDEELISEAITFSGLNGISPNTLLGKEIGGTDLSGGEWQKLAIARAAYRNRDFIVLDEPTSNLDPLAEAEVFQKYLELTSDKTVIFVTHRISVAALAERIIVFNDGKIVEEGNHHELLAQDGKYATLYREQAKWYNR